MFLNNFFCSLRSSPDVLVFLMTFSWPCDQSNEGSGDKNGTDAWPEVSETNPQWGCAIKIVLLTHDNYTVDSLSLHAWTIGLLKIKFKKRLSKIQRSLNQCSPCLSQTFKRWLDATLLPTSYLTTGLLKERYVTLRYVTFRDYFILKPSMLLI